MEQDIALDLTAERTEEGLIVLKQYKGPPGLNQFDQMVLTPNEAQGLLNWLCERNLEQTFKD